MLLPCLPASAAEPESECWAVIVGISEYGTLDDATGCAWGAEELCQRLRPVWGKEHIRLLQDSEATKAEIRSAVSWLVDSEGAEDTVLLYYSAHGDRGYLSTYNARYKETWISTQELSQWLCELDSERVIIILDSCYAGYFSSPLSKDGRVVLLSSAADEVSYGIHTDDDAHNVFTYYLIEAWDEFSLADLNWDYKLSAEELFLYAEPETVFLTDGFDEGVQHPLLSDNYVGDLSLLLSFIFDTEPALPSASGRLILDGKAYSAFPLELEWAPGSVHEIGVVPSLDTGNGTRYTFASWSDGYLSDSRIISGGGNYTAEYGTEHLLSVESEYGEPEGVGWYKEGSVATISVSSIEEGATRRIFDGWSGGYSGNEATGQVVMDSPFTVRANWQTEHLLSVESEYGEPEGAGWYDEGSTATISVPAYEGLIIRHAFNGWSGDLNGAEPAVTLVVNAPLAVKANWRTDYTQLYLIIAGIIGIIAIIVVVSRIGRRDDLI